MYFLAGHRNYSFVLTKASAVDKCNKAGDVYGKMLVLTFEDNEDAMMNRILSLINTKEEVIQMSGMNEHLLNFKGLMIDEVQRVIIREKPYFDKQLAEVLTQQEQIQRKSSKVATDLARLSVFKGNLREMEVQQRVDEQAREQNREKKHKTQFNHSVRCMENRRISCTFFRWEKEIYGTDRKADNGQRTVSAYQKENRKNHLQRGNSFQQNEQGNHDG